MVFDIRTYLFGYPGLNVSRSSSSTLVCHGELARTKPGRAPSHGLLHVDVGRRVIGGIFAGLIRAEVFTWVAKSALIVLAIPVPPRARNAGRHALAACSGLRDRPSSRRDVPA